MPSGIAIAREAAGEMKLIEESLDVSSESVPSTNDSRILLLELWQETLFRGMLGFCDVRIPSSSGSPLPLKRSGVSRATHYSFSLLRLLNASRTEKNIAEV